MTLDVLRLIIAGSRTLTLSTDQLHTHVRRFLASQLFTIEQLEIVSGGAPGMDACGERYSREKLGKEPKVFPANWNLYGKGAGPKRNEEMALYADAALVFFDRRPTPGSSNMYVWMVLLDKPAKAVSL